MKRGKVKVTFDPSMKRQSQTRSTVSVGNTSEKMQINHLEQISAHGIYIQLRRQL